ncbi:MAG: hypothetical protein KME42_17740 [Tildeniella nuda ZEHNDER 1965/U140]|jgi:hypothetical protein|nr:hypothetical protein [Tildeniella nuda ZEHNDER 1965/U140]
MAFAVAIFTSLVFLIIVDFLSQIKLPKTPEEEIGEAVTKYLAENRKKREEKKKEEKKKDT